MNACAWEKEWSSTVWRRLAGAWREAVGDDERQRAVLGPGEVGVADAAEHVHEVVVVPLRLGGVERGQHLQLLARLQGLDVPRLV